TQTRTHWARHPILLQHLSPAERERFSMPTIAPCTSAGKAIQPDHGRPRAQLTKGKCEVTSSALRRPHQLRDHLLQRGQIEWLGHEKICASGDCRLGVLRLGTGRHYDNRYVADFRIGTNLTHELEPVHAGHFTVRHHEQKGLLAQLLQRGWPVMTLLDIG